MRRKLVSLLLLVGLGQSAALEAQGALFACNEAGFDEMLAEASGGNPGPHTFDCTAADLPLVLAGFKSIPRSVTIDGQGLLAIEGWMAFLGDFPASPTTVVRLENMTLRDFRLSPLPARDVLLDLRNMHFTGTGAVVARTVSLVDSIISDLTATSGPAVVAFESLDIVRSQIVNSSAVANLVDATGIVSITDSEFRANESAVTLDASGATGLISRTTIAGNESGVVGGIMAGSGVTIENSTISGNTVLPSDIGIIVQAGAISGCPIVRNSTITGNVAPSGAAFSDFMLSSTGGGPAFFSCSDPTVGFEPPANFVNTIMDGACVLLSELTPGVPGSNGLPPVSGGGNIETGGDSCSFGEFTDQINVSSEQLALGPLVDSFGPGSTHALLPGSVAIDSGVLASCPLTDQRGAPRPEPLGSACDTGAFELLPEPGTMVGLSVGGVLLCGMGLRRRRQDWA